MVHNVTPRLEVERLMLTTNQVQIRQMFLMYSISVRRDLAYTYATASGIDKFEPIRFLRNRYNKVKKIIEHALSGVVSLNECENESS